MSSISSNNSSSLDIGANCPLPNGPKVSSANIRKVCWLFALALTMGTLAECTQYSSISDKSGSLVPSRRASQETYHKPSFVSDGHLNFVTNRHAPSASPERARETQDTSYGLASYYEHDSETASGERFDARELTAAHPTLPFGTRVRVTNHSNGRSVVVTINDRGPFVRGRIIDVTPAAAHALGISGLAPVTVERE